VCVLVNSPRMTSERYTPFGMLSDIPMQTLASAQTCNLVSRVTGQRLLAKGVTEFTWASQVRSAQASIRGGVHWRIRELSTGGQRAGAASAP
jgi:hypothetical protein